MGAEIASEGLKGRVFEFSLGDLNNDEDLVSTAGFVYHLDLSSIFLALYTTVLQRKVIR